SDGIAVSNEVDKLSTENEVLRRKLAHIKEQYRQFQQANASDNPWASPT
ncbi:hypothetical protein A2U01_0071583, partial [Trifolium medium]|nr:hypothetical protein [Trifolium medium]